MEPGVTAGLSLGTDTLDAGDRPTAAPEPEAAPHATG